ncbi:MAG: hypothetical protein ACM31I_07450 [Deltaproteobacteria bacterium]
MRAAVLVGALVVAAAWAGGVYRIRAARVKWDRPVEVAVVLLSATEIDALRFARMEDGLSELGDRLSAEFARYRGGSGTPFSFRLVGPVPFDGALSLTPESPGAIDRAMHAYRLWRTLRGVHAAARFDPEPYDARIYLLLEPATVPEGTRTFAEGSGAAGGEVGLVRAAASSDDAVLALTAVAHELLHCLGATDKYDSAGHALAPDGLAEPDLSPQYPQRYAEWMVGEVPTGPGQGRIPSSLAEIRVGPATAREIGWTPPPGP